MTAASQSVMEGRGVYNANSALQASGAALALPLLEAAAANIPAPDADRPVVIVDYGSSEGRNSVAPMRLAIEILRKRFGDRRPVRVVHTDLPANDFSTLFAVVESDVEGYAGSDPFVFPSAVGRSFYRQVTPDAETSLGWSSYAAQWLSAIPGPIPGHIMPYRAAGPLRDAFRQQGRRDWEGFLELRAAELRRGGALVICLPSLDDNGEHPGAALFDAANDAIAEMVADGVLSESERHRMCIGTYPRTPAETMAPFAETGAKFGLRVVTSGFKRIPDQGWSKFEQNHDAEALAAQRAGFFRATFGPSLANGLNARDEAGARQAFAKLLEQGVKRRIAVNPAPINNIVALLSLAKN